MGGQSLLPISTHPFHHIDDRNNSLFIFTLLDTERHSDLLVAIQMFNYG